MKIAFYNVEQWEQDYLSKQLPNVSFPEELGGDFDIVSIFIDTPVNTCFLDKFQNLKCIVTRSTGFDHIDLQACKERNISVCNVPDYAKNTVAEFSFALILALARKVFQSYQVVQTTGKFIRDGLMGFDLKGKTVGVIGTGNIGSCFIEIAQGYGMNVIAHDIDPHLPVNYVSLEELLKRSDIVSLHVPYNEHTHYLLNKNNIPLMKNGSYLINTSRGKVLEMEALLNAIESGKIAGAGLDVIEDEKNLSSDVSQRLIAHPHTIITPHNAYNTQEAIQRILDATILNVKNIMNDTPSNVILKK